MTACRCDAEPTYGSNPHRRGGDRFKKNRNNPPLGGGAVLQTAGFRYERWFRISALRLAQSRTLQLGRTPIRFKKILTFGPQPEAESERQRHLGGGEFCNFVLSVLKHGSVFLLYAHCNTLSQSH